MEPPARRLAPTVSSIAGFTLGAPNVAAVARRAVDGSTHPDAPRVPRSSASADPTHAQYPLPVGKPRFEDLCAAFHGPDQEDDPAAQGIEGRHQPVVFGKLGRLQDAATRGLRREVAKINLGFMLQQI